MRLCFALDFEYCSIDAASQLVFCCSLHHRQRLTPWEPDDTLTRTLRFLVEQRRRLVGDRTRINNRLTALLKLYFPQALDWFPDLRTRLVCDFLTQWPTLEAVQQAHPAILEHFFRSHHAARQDWIELRLQAIKVSQLLLIDPAVINASTVLLKARLAQKRVTLNSISEFDHQIDQLSQAHVDDPLFAAFPGAGPVFFLASLISSEENMSSFVCCPLPKFSQ